MNPIFRFSHDFDENRVVRRLEEMSRHARRVVWLTPEPEWGRNLGSCDMGLYERTRNHVEIGRTVNRLASVAGELVKDRV